jgi:hypothetical protein
LRTGKGNEAEHSSRGGAQSCGAARQFQVSIAFRYTGEAEPREMKVSQGRMIRLVICGYVAYMRGKNNRSVTWMPCQSKPPMKPDVDLICTGMDRQGMRCTLS